MLLLIPVPGTLKGLPGSERLMFNDYQALGMQWSVSLFGIKDPRA